MHLLKDREYKTKFRDYKMNNGMKDRLHYAEFKECALFSLNKRKIIELIIEITHMVLKLEKMF